MERLVLQENTGNSGKLWLSASDASAVNNSGLVDAVPTADGLWRLSARTNRVGAIRVGTKDIVVQPKACFSSLLFMLAYARDQGLSPTEFDGLADDDVWPAVGETLVRLVERALQRGVLRGYVTRDDRLPMTRGRIRVSDQLSRHFGLPIPLEVRYSDLTGDTPENRILRTALRRMASIERMPGTITRNLLHLEGRLGAARLLKAGAPLPEWKPNRLNERYVPALHLSELILDSIGLSTLDGNQTMASFVVNMADTFEDFVCTALSEALAALGPGRSVTQHETPLTEDLRFTVRPDLVHFIDGMARAVYDAKYKLEEKSDDLYQVYAYCTILNLRSGHLVYAGSRFGLKDVVATIRNSTVQITFHPLNVAAQPSQLLTQIRQIAAASMA